MAKFERVATRKDKSVAVKCKSRNANCSTASSMHALAILATGFLFIVEHPMPVTENAFSRRTDRCETIGIHAQHRRAQANQGLHSLASE